MAANDYLKIFTKEGELVEWVESLDAQVTDSGSPQIFNEIPTGVIDGVNSQFTTGFPYVVGTLRVFFNGSRKYPLAFTRIDEYTFELPVPPFVGDKLMVDYEKLV